MSTDRARDRARVHYGYPGWVPSCPSCGAALDECVCVCPFCFERDGCLCCIGPGIATGGD